MKRREPWEEKVMGREMQVRVEVLDQSPRLGGCTNGEPSGARVRVPATDSDAMGRKA